MAKIRRSEFRSYPDVRDDLRARGWNTDSPSESPRGEVYDQHEAVADDGLRAALGRKAPEFVVVLDPSRRIFWTIEVKSSLVDLDQAVREAAEYARAIDAVDKQRCAFYTGIAGNPREGYVRRTFFITASGAHEPVEFEGSAMTSLFAREQLAEILAADTGQLDDIPIDEQALLRIADQINAALHEASVARDARAAVVASVLLTMASDNMPAATLDPVTYVDQVNITARSMLARPKKDHLAAHIALQLPAGVEAQKKFVQALIHTADRLRHLNIAAAMRSGSDILGEFYEAFLRYGNAAKDLGIVLTPRHVTRWAVEVVQPTEHDVVFDPTAGTGGFLVSAYDHVRREASSEAEFDRFRQTRIFGIEQQPRIAALAAINMIFRGDGSTNIADEDALKYFLAHDTQRGSRTAKFKSEAGPPGATKVLMNPPFALKKDDEKEYEFVEHALRQVERDGLLFAILPAPVMVKDGGPKLWRKDRLLPQHTVRAVVALPEDLFYPVSVDTVAVIIQKGRPHRSDDQVLWAKVDYDGYAKVKGKRLPAPRVEDQLSAITQRVREVVIDPSYTIASEPGLIKRAPIDLIDPLIELVPQAYLDEPRPSADEVREDLGHAIREYLALMIRTGSGTLVTEIVESASGHMEPPGEPHGFAPMPLTQIFPDITRGGIHSLNVEIYGRTPVISTSTADNGIIGFYELDSRWPRRQRVVTVASNGTPLTSFFHPYEIAPKDDVFCCQVPQEMDLATIFYVLTALNAMTWRYSYYRKCYRNKIAKIDVLMPVGADGELDIAWLQRVASSCPGWRQLESSIDRWVPQPWQNLGRRTARPGRAAGVEAAMAVVDDQ